jgi:hypothetical protein
VNLVGGRSIEQIVGYPNLKFFQSIVVASLIAGLFSGCDFSEPAASVTRRRQTRDEFLHMLSPPCRDRSLRRAPLPAYPLQAGAHLLLDPCPCLIRASCTISGGSSPAGLEIASIRRRGKPGCASC